MKKTFCRTKLLLPLIALQLCLFAACDDDTAAIGSTVMPDHDNVATSQKTFAINTVTVRADSVLANTNDSYLGCVIDPETRAKTTCNFLAQFNVMESTTFPERDRMITDDKGNIVIDSCRVRIFIDDYYGDSLTTMKLHMQELDTNKVISENTPYYTNLNANKFLTPGKGISKTVSYAIRDLTRPDSSYTSNTLRSIVINLPTSYGRYLIEKFYENPAYYHNSFNFIRHVCPGFYFKITGGVGSMLAARTTTLDVYFRYHTRENGHDTIYNGMQRLAATEEVIQQTMTDTKIPDTMLDPASDYTYIKSPAGLFTELELPVSDIVAGEHYTDTINSASLSLIKENSTNETTSRNNFKLEVPPYLVLVRKQAAKAFFENNRLPNSTDSYITGYQENYGSYAFNNISVLITRMKDERDNGAGVTSSDTEVERNAKYTVWEAQNPDWNKVLVIPVAAEYTTKNDIYGNPVKTLLNVKNQLGMYSVKLLGGQHGRVKLDVIYSHFSR